MQSHRWNTWYALQGLERAAPHCPTRSQYPLKTSLSMQQPLLLSRRQCIQFHPDDHVLHHRRHSSPPRTTPRATAHVGSRSRSKPGGSDQLTDEPFLRKKAGTS